MTDDAQGTAEKLAAIHSYLTSAQIRSSPKILMLRGADPEVLADVITRVRGDR